MTIYFISGHLDLTIDEFREHYVPRIDAALAAKASFVVGDARGCDLMAQTHLQYSKALVHVFHMHGTPRNCLHGFPRTSGFTSDASRDAAMTAASDDDIAWVRPGREKSGTAANRCFSGDMLRARSVTRMVDCTRISSTSAVCLTSSG